MSDRQALLEVAIDVARAAGETLHGFASRRASGEDLDVSSKTTATDPVSAADRAAEQLIARRLAEARPDDGLLGEEGQAPRRGTSGLRWVVDPLDGTVNFLYGVPAWCVSVACEDDEGSLVGVVHDPNRDETFRAVRGGGAWCGEQRLTMTAVDDLSRTLLATGFAYDPATRRDWADDVADLLGHVRDLRRGGSAALDLAWTAAGRFDAYLEFGLSPWDWAAGSLLVTEAGGTLTRPERWLGGQVRAGVLAAGAVAHDGLDAWLAGRPPHPGATGEETT
jgi:myo-inositol-1(or 4)-monophosphatase